VAGEKLFNDFACSTCHKEDGSGRGPVLNGVPGSTVQLADGSSVVADDNYLHESIVMSVAKVVRGYQPIMPVFQGQISEEQVMQLIAYIKSLKAPGTAPAAQ
jgi:cytochrome c oxidase subunit 2